MKKDDEANDNNEPIIWLSVCFSFFLFLMLLCLLSLCLCFSHSHKTHREESGRRKRKVNFFLLMDVCVR